MEEKSPPESKQKLGKHFTPRFVHKEILSHRDKAQLTPLSRVRQMGTEIEKKSAYDILL